MRRLSSPKYRTHDFTRAYLAHLDSLRYDDAELAARLAAQVAVRLVPALPGPREEGLALQCLALGIFGSARRQKGQFSATAAAFRLALEVSRRAGLQEVRGNLLLRASYLLKDFGHFHRALALLNEALAIFVQLGSCWGIGRALVDHGMMRSALGDFEDAVLDLEQALEHLAGSEAQLSRNHLSAYQFAAYAYDQRPQTDDPLGSIKGPQPGDPCGSIKGPQTGDPLGSIHGPQTAAASRKSFTRTQHLPAGSTTSG